MCLLGWPTVDTTAVSERELRSLTGEGIHLGCKSLLLAAVFLDETAPWWPAVCDEQSGESASSSGPAGAVPPKRRRRLGPVKSFS